MIRVEEGRDWIGELGHSAARKAAASLREAARRARAAAVAALVTLAMVATAAGFLILGAARLRRESRLPPGLSVGLWAGAGLLAGFLLWRGALAGGAAG